MKRRRAPKIAAFLALGMLAAGCATILELDGYDDAITLLCQCPGFEAVADCVGSASKRMDFADDAEREAWLVGFRNKQCGTVCDRADECYGDVPGCQDKRPGCECCSWKDDVLACTSGICATCRTCAEIATDADDGLSSCVSGKVLHAALQRCACEKCPTECTAFCQGTGLLQDNGADVCSMCLNNTCSSSMTACLADAP